ncbi:hypothetical protein J437_LFUL015776 [Ladona fulva]|uniref:Uncharacterized protein n=1 Tax=Ladona fulva TaxID=123851 RepID=A0A8K0KLP3_LADFU|nr:hypothetical protein J437_LFUL015776 [Ladona fulva]
MVLQILGQPPFTPPKVQHFRRPSPQSGLTDMISDMLAVIPTAQIIDWYHKTCEPDPEFQELMAKLKGEDFLKVVARFRADPAFSVMRSGLTDLGIDMVAVEAWLNRVFGWPIPSRF